MKSLENDLFLGDDNNIFNDYVKSEKIKSTTKIISMYKKWHKCK